MTDKQTIARLKQEENAAFREMQEASRALESAQRDSDEARDIYHRRRTIRRTAQWMVGPAGE